MKLINSILTATLAIIFFTANTLFAQIDNSSINSHHLNGAHFIHGQADFKHGNTAFESNLFSQNSLIDFGTSLNWAGYVASTGKFSSVSGTWTIPKVHNNKNFKADATWVGIGGVKTTDLIQAGTQAITGLNSQSVTNRNGIKQAKTSRSGSSILYQAWFEMLPGYSQQIPILVSSGDSITVSISQTSKNKWHIKLVNNTNNQSFQTTVHYVSSLSSAEWIEEMPSIADPIFGSSFIPIDNFNTVRFSKAYAIQNHVQVSVAESGAQAVAMISPDGKVLAAPSRLAKNGASFKIGRALSKLLALKAKRFKFAANRVWLLGQ